MKSRLAGLYLPMILNVYHRGEDAFFFFSDAGVSLCGPTDEVQWEQSL